jgi:LysR family transcriptional regulator, nitrogen assimilation regulatory protein
VKLLDRSVSGVTPTPAGKVLYAHAQNILRQVEDMRQAVHREMQPLSGAVNLGMSPTMVTRFALPLIEKVCSQHPEMHLQIREEGSAVLNELLINGRIELSISPTRPDNELIVGEELLTEPLMLMYPASWSITPDAPLEELAALPWIVPRRPHSIRAVVDGVFAAASLSPYVVVELDSLQNVIETVRRGLGVAAMVADAVKADLGAGTVKCRPLGNVSPMRPMFLAHRRTPSLSRPAQFVHDVLRDIAAELRLEDSHRVESHTAH